MANVFIGTNLQLKDKNFSKTMKKIADDTKKSTDSIASQFSKIGTAVKGLAAAAGVKALFSEVAESLKQTERSIGSLQAITGTVEDAKSKFQELNDVSRKIPQSFDEITQSALALGKSGLDTSAGSIEALAKIARGTGTSMTSLAQALSNASLGQLKGLKQLGIVAKQEGDKISLTYQGITETISNNSAELQNYINRLANTKFANTLKPEMEGVTGASKQMGEAWGDLTRQLGQSGLGQIIVDSLNMARDAFDWFTAELQKPTLKSIVQGMSDIFKGFAESVKGFFEQLGDTWSDVTDNLNKDTESSAKAQITTFGNWLSFVGIVIREFIGYVQKALGAWQSFTSAIGSQMAKLTHGDTAEILAKSSANSALIRIAKEKGDFEKAKADLIAKTNAKSVTDQDVLKFMKSGMFTSGQIDYAKAYKDNLENQKKHISASNKTFTETLIDDINKSNKNINEQINKFYDDIANGIAGSKGGKILTKDDLTGNNGGNAPTNLDDGKPIGGISSGSSGGSSSSSMDTWTRYYERFLDEKAKTLSKAEQLEYNHHKKLEELNKTFAENSNVSQSQYDEVKSEIERKYIEDKKALEQETYDFIQSLRNDETFKIQEEYTSKLAQLEEFHSMKLISEQTYLEQEKALRDEFYKQDEEYQKKLRKDKQDKKMEPYLATADALDTLSDAFSGLTDNMSEQSGAYKALFAVQKGFAVASATAQAVVAWMNALSSGPWPTNLAAYGQAVAMTTSILGELKSITMHDKGGNIPSGGLGIVGEFGPELVRGPASVTSRKDTADLLSKGSNVTVNLIEDSSRAGQVNQSKDEDENTIIDVIVSNIRNGGSVASAMASTYGLERMGY